MSEGSLPGFSSDLYWRVDVILAACILTSIIPGSFKFEEDQNGLLFYTLDFLHHFIFTASHSSKDARGGTQTHVRAAGTIARKPGHCIDSPSGNNESAWFPVGALHQHRGFRSDFA